MTSETRNVSGISQLPKAGKSESCRRPASTTYIRRKIVIMILLRSTLARAGYIRKIIVFAENKRRYTEGLSRTACFTLHARCCELGTP